MRSGFLTFFAVIVLVISFSSAAARVGEADSATPRGRNKVLRQVTQDLCDRKIVMLGENGFHGGGETIAFKAELVKRLIQTCHFNAVYFESSHYDFLAFVRKRQLGETVSRDMVASAIGQIWNQNRDMSPLIDFLFEEAASGRVSLGGLDDQLGGRGMFYSLEQLPADLARILNSSRQGVCHAAFRRRIWSAYSRDDPYSPDHRQALRDCLSDVKNAAAVSKDGGSDIDLLQMVNNFQRLIARDFLPPQKRILARDYSMYLNLRWLAERYDPHSKIIVWSANGHIRKDSGDGSEGEQNLGSYVDETYGDQAAAIGFSAASGTFRYDSRTAKAVAPAPQISIETAALNKTHKDVAYIKYRQLLSLGTISGGVGDDHVQLVARWADAYDGIVVFRAERPPQRLDD